MATPQVVERSVTVYNNSPIQDYVHSDDQNQPTFVLLLFFSFGSGNYLFFGLNDNFAGFFNISLKQSHQRRNVA